MSREIRIATRKSALALWQAEYVKARLEQAHPGIRVSLVPMVSKGDKLLDAPLAKIGGKGLFVKELETALLENEADIAVHSMKDVPMDFPEGLGLYCICEREDPRDAFVSNRFDSLDALPAGSVVGTSSLRRQAQLLARRPDLKIQFLRGNVNTRLAKLDAGEYDAIILAAAGLIRLGFQDRIRSSISVEDSLPAGGQGAVGIECRSADSEIHALLAPLHHQATALRVTADLPHDWPRFHLRRQFRGAAYEITVRRAEPGEQPCCRVDGATWQAEYLPVVAAGKTAQVEILV